MIKNFSSVQYDIVPLAGGLDQITPALSVKPGFCRRAANWECDITGGYTRIAGYERYDGRPRPSDALYAVVGLSSVAGFAPGQTITQGMRSGQVVGVNADSVVITRFDGDFAIGQPTSNGTATATVTDFSRVVGDPRLDAQYKHLAANAYRADIQVVPGSGPILGVAFYKGKVYAWRNNASGTAAVMYAASPTGWQAIPLFEELHFTNANVSVNDGDIITQGSATATVRRVVVRTGTLMSGTNAGTLVISNRTGNFTAGAATTTGGGTLTLGGAQSAITFAPGGKFNAVVANFGGGPQNQRMYAADGVNRAFEFDGTVVVPINTGMTPDAPQIAVVHKQHLFLSFGYSLQYSGVGDPYAWTPILGAGEIAMNGDITAVIQLPGDQTDGALAIYTRNETSILYGSSSQNFQLSNFNTSAGATPGSAQNLEQTYFLTDQGVVTLAVTQRFGNFEPSTLTTALQPFIRQHYPFASTSGISREKGQYRMFFSDGFGLYATVRNGQFLGAMPVQFPDAVLCMTEGERSDGSKTSYFGSHSGYVFEIDAGTSFDGADIAANFTLVFNQFGNSRVLKRYRKASVEVFGNSYSEFAVGFDLGYRSMEVEQSFDSLYKNDLRSSYWDEFSWEQFLWDGSELSPTEIEVSGTAENLAFRFSSVSSIFKPFTLNSVTVHFSPRRGLR